MTIRNLDWYNLNEQRSYPFDDTATLVDDEGVRLLHHYVADLNIRFPKSINGVSMGDRAHVSSLTVSPKVVTVIIHSSMGERLASVSISRPVDQGRHHNLDPAQPGIGGWIVFGSGLDEEEAITIQFSNSYQGLLTTKVARPYPPLAVESMAKLNTQESLTGVVKLEGGQDIEIIKSPRVILGESRPNTIVFRLDEDTTSSGEVSIYEKYAGPCGLRPESRNCENGEPIEFINTVSPDCCGNIFLEFRGCADIISVQQDLLNPMTPTTGVNECGVVIDCGVGLAAACVSPDRLPDDEGNLPNEYDDNCADVVIDDTDPPIDELPDIADDNGEPNPDPGDDTNDTANLPYEEDFDS
jgi:hypothetical protein